MIAALLVLLGFVAGSLWTLFVVGLSGREDPDTAEDVIAIIEDVPGVAG